VIACGCRAVHAPRKVVITGGPGAGKTAVIELIRQAFCAHVGVVQESAGVVFGGGFPRRGEPAVLRATQRAIYYVQRELEAIATPGAAITLCDRGTVDGAAYWPGPGELWTEVGSTIAAELARYDVVIHLRTPPANGGYNHQNPLRLESAAEARAIDVRIAEVWAPHPCRHEIAPTADFMTKARRAVEILRDELPACCARPAP